MKLLILSDTHVPTRAKALPRQVLAEVVEAGVSKEALNLGCCQLVLPSDE